MHHARPALGRLGPKKRQLAECLPADWHFVRSPSSVPAGYRRATLQHQRAFAPIRCSTRSVCDCTSYPQTLSLSPAPPPVRLNMVGSGGFRALGPVLCVVLIALMPMARPQSARFCGSTLLRALDTVCDGVYQDLANKKRATGDGGGRPMGELLLPPFTAPGEAGQLQLQRFGRQAPRTFSHRYASDIVVTCCLNPCDYRTLRSYCKV